MNDATTTLTRAGWLVHRTWLDAHETRFVMQTLRNQLGRHVYPVHRLDKGTSGVLLMALDPDAARAMAQLFEARQTVKHYVALVRGWPVSDAARVKVVVASFIQPEEVYPLLAS